MVSITLSTVSVITSIVIYRLNDSASSPVPYYVRVVVLRHLARVVCVRASQTSSTSTLYSRASTSSPSCDASVNNTAVQNAANTKTDLDDRQQGSTSADCCCQMKSTVANLLCELRKVTVSYSCFFIRSFRLSFICSFLSFFTLCTYGLLVNERNKTVVCTFISVE